MSNDQNDSVPDTTDDVEGHVSSRRPGVQPQVDTDDDDVEGHNMFRKL